VERAKQFPRTNLIIDCIYSIVRLLVQPVHPMAPSLRKRLTRHTGRDELNDLDTTEIPSALNCAESSSLDVPSTPKGRTDASEIHECHNVGTPPPPPQQAVHLVSPSTASLQRYKLHAPSIIAPAATPSRVLDNSTKKASSSFSEVFNDGCTSSSSKSVEPLVAEAYKRDFVATTDAKSQVLPSRKSRNLDYSTLEMSSTLTALENLTVNDAEVYEHGTMSTGRTMQSQIRRAQRTDSATNSLHQEHLGNSDISHVRKRGEQDVPPALRIHKKGNSSEQPLCYPSPGKIDIHRDSKSYNGSTIPPQTVSEPVIESTRNRYSSAAAAEDIRRSPDSLSASQYSLPQSPNAEALACLYDELLEMGRRSSTKFGRTQP